MPLVAVQIERKARSSAKDLKPLDYGEAVERLFSKKTSKQLACFDKLQEVVDEAVESVDRKHSRSFIEEVRGVIDNEMRECMPDFVHRPTTACLTNMHSNMHYTVDQANDTRNLQIFSNPNINVNVNSNQVGLKIAPKIEAKGRSKYSKIKKTPLNIRPNL